MKTLFVLAALVASTTALIYCPPDICDKFNCGPKIMDCSGRIDPKGGFCQCCPACITQINVGEFCGHTLLLGAPANAECEPGTTCDLSTRVCSQANCAETRGRLLSQMNGMPLPGRSLPVCDENGDYVPFQCIGSVCHCVSGQGERIEGYEGPIHEVRNMDCKCARTQHRYMKTGLIGKMFFCEQNGSYARRQCTGSVCYCVDEFGKQRNDQTEPIGQSNLNC